MSLNLKAFLIALALASGLIATVFLAFGTHGIEDAGRGETPRTDGQGGAPEVVRETYRVDDAEVSFDQPEGYYLMEREAGTAERPQRAIVLVEDTPLNRDLLDGKVTEPMEGPTAITIDVYQNPEGLSAEAWAMQDTNWNISSKQTSAVSVDGVLGVSYTWDGLYQGKSAIVTRGELAYVFSVTWMTPEDQILTEYDALLASVDFTQ